MVVQEKNQFDVELKQLKVRLVENQIVENKIKKGAQIDVDDNKKLKQVNLTLAKVQKYVVLVFSEEFTSITKEARGLTLCAKLTGNDLLKVFLIEKLAQKIIVNFYMKVNSTQNKT